MLFGEKKKRDQKNIDWCLFRPQAMSLTRLPLSYGNLEHRRGRNGNNEEWVSFSVLSLPLAHANMNKVISLLLPVCNRPLCYNLTELALSVLQLTQNVPWFHCWLFPERSIHFFFLYLVLFFFPHHSFDPYQHPLIFHWILDPRSAAFVLGSQPLFCPLNWLGRFELHQGKLGVQMFGLQTLFCSVSLLKLFWILKIPPTRLFKDKTARTFLDECCYRSSLLSCQHLILSLRDELILRCWISLLCNFFHI